MYFSTKWENLEIRKMVDSRTRGSTILGSVAKGRLRMKTVFWVWKITHGDFNQEIKNSKTEFSRKKRGIANWYLAHTNEILGGNLE